jgi:hypothetical protein
MVMDWGWEMPKDSRLETGMLKPWGMDWDLH